MAKQDDYVRYTIRVPARLYAQIEDAAGEKSVNAEINARLQGSFEENFTDAVLLDRIKELVLAKRITDLFGSEISDGISVYAQNHTDADDWKSAVEELLEKALIAEGIMAENPDLPIGGPYRQFWRTPEAQEFMETKMRERWDAEKKEALADFLATEPDQDKSE